MEFKNITSVDAVEEVPEGATVLGVVDGALKQMPTSGMGGGKQLVISTRSLEDTRPDYANTTANMTLDEAYELFVAHELTGGMVFYDDDHGLWMSNILMLAAYPTDVVKALGFSDDSNWFVWTETGFSSEDPSGANA